MPDFDISGILANGLAQRQQYLNQPKGWTTALPVIGNAVNDIVAKKMQLQAQQDYANFLSLPPEQRQDPQNAMRGYKAALALGINPTQQVFRPGKPVISEDEKLKNIEEESAARARGTNKGGGVDQTTTDKMAQMLANGTPVNQITQSLGRSGSKSMPAILKKAFEINPNLRFDFSQLDYQTKLSLMHTNMGSAVQLPARKVAAMLPRIDAAVKASDAVPRSEMQYINRVGIKVAAANGNRAAQQLLATTKLVADEFQAQFGQGSDSKLDLAMSLLDSSQTVEQFRDSAKNMKDAMIARREALLTGNVPKSEPASSPSSSLSSSNDDLDALMKKHQ